VSSQSNVPTYRENGTRGIAVKPSLGTASYRVRRNDEPIGPENSMMIEVRVDRTCYLTIVDVDSVGGVTLLYPNEWSEEKGYYPDGRIPGGQNVRFPDKNARNNRSGFLWEVQPPAGPSTIRVFASTDRETAVMMRDYVKQAEDSMKRFRSTGNVSEGIAPLRELRKVLFRGVLVVDSAAQPSGTRPEVGQNEGATGQGGGTDVPDWTATTVNYRVVE